VKPPHRFVLTELLCQIDGLDETMARFDEQVAAYCTPFDEAVALLDTIPGVGRSDGATDRERNRDGYGTVSQCAPFGGMGRGGSGQP